jgi:hypothetical protein
MTATSTENGGTAKLVFTTRSYLRSLAERGGYNQNIESKSSEDLLSSTGLTMVTVATDVRSLHHLHLLLPYRSRSIHESSIEKKRTSLPMKTA